MECETIYFYDVASDRVKEENIFLNNFSISPFTLDGKDWISVEHYYQAYKFPVDSEQFESIRTAENPDKAKKLAKTYGFDAEDWMNYKDDVMRRALYAKYTQDNELKQRLLDTGNARLVEDSPRDEYWGGVLPNSLNKLGDCLMELRDKLRNE